MAGHFTFSPTALPKDEPRTVVCSGWRGLKTMSREHVGIRPLQRLGRFIGYLDRPGAVLHDDLTILAIEESTERGYE